VLGAVAAYLTFKTAMAIGAMLDVAKKALIGMQVAWAIYTQGATLAALASPLSPEASPLPPIFATEVPDEAVFGRVPGRMTPHVYREPEIVELLGLVTSSVRRIHRALRVAM
jgi:hypothetical protein